MSTAAASSTAATPTGARASANLSERFERLRQLHAAEPFPSYASRRLRLKRLLSMSHDMTEELAEAISSDFGHRSPYDTRLGESWLVVKHLRYALRHLKGWMKPRPAQTNWVFWPGRSQVIPQPLGVVGIISAWNYPFMLALEPLVGAIAAGNRVLLKLSELAPRTAELIAARLTEALGSDYVEVVQGGPQVASEFCRLPFDHLLFTGSPEVGKKVALAAAENLVPLTLELGGKCPAILHPSFSLERFAASIVQGKCYSAGQSCVAPDYLLVPEGKQDQVVAALTQRIARCFPTMLENPDYTSVAGATRRERLRQIVGDAVEKGATCVEVNPANESFEGSLKMPLTVLSDVPAGCRAVEEELFGPVLPIVTYRDLSEAKAYVAARPRPLALYYFDNDRSRVRQVLRDTVSGGATINDTLAHFLIDDLPRGGVGLSGYGAYHGRGSFDTFSHLKGVFQQSRLNASGLLAPPYGQRADRILRVLLGRKP